MQLQVRVLAPVAETQSFGLDLVAVVAEVILRVLPVRPEVFFAFEIHVESHFGVPLLFCFPLAEGSPSVASRR